MPYYKVLMRTGHWGVGSDRANYLFVRGANMLEAITYAKKIPSVKHNTMPISAVEIGEDEFIINNSVSYIMRHYENRAVPLTLKDFSKYIVHNVQLEKKFNSNYKRGYLTNLYLEKFYDCCNEKDNKKKAEKREEFRKMIVNYYNNQERIMQTLEDASVKPSTEFSRNAETNIIEMSAKH